MDSIKRFSRFDLIKQVIGKSFIFICVPPNISSDFPKDVNINFQIIMILLYFTDDSAHFFWIKMIVSNNNEYEIFQDPHFILILYFL